MSQARIMIFEDERITAEDIHDILTQLGYLVTAVVSSGRDAIREAERTKPDLVMMDIRIQGDMDGIETARATSMARLTSSRVTSRWCAVTATWPGELMLSTC